jgi:hypothetical protein
MIEWIQVSSTNLSRVRYDDSLLTLEIEFQGGRVYQYFDVPAHVFDGLLRADSHGTFFNAQIKGYYRYARV